MSDPPAVIASPVAAGFRSRCPRCGVGRLFAGGMASLELARACDRCGLDLSFADAGDGPAVFAIFVLGVLVLGLALFVEFTFAPPLWVHPLVFGPLTLFLAFGMLKPIKGALVAQQYVKKAAPGRLSGSDGASH